MTEVEYGPTDLKEIQDVDLKKLSRDTYLNNKTPKTIRK